MKDELGGKIMVEFAALTPKTYSCLTYNKDKNKNANKVKEVCHKRKP